MSEKTRLRWRRHQLPVTGPPSVEAAGHAGAAAADLQAGVDWPVLPDTPLEKAVTLLRVAAEIEHALMVQYLYAGYSFTETQRDIADVAIEEMSHFMTVQNLLRCLGEEAPHLHRQDYGPPTNEDERLFPFDLRLEPLSHLSLAKYIVAESPSAPSLPPDVKPEVYAHIRQLATGPNGPVNHVGTVYTLLGAVFGSEELLSELAATGDPWYVDVNARAAEAAMVYHGRDKLHVPDSAFRPETAPQQTLDEDWDRSVVNNNLDEFRVWVIEGRRDALRALRDIGLQGEGPSPVATETSHFRRFYDLFVHFFDDDGMGTDPPSGVMDVPAGSRIVLDEAGAGENVISHPTTVRWAKLADLRYAILLAALERYLRAPADDRAFLRGWCFAEMFALKKLAEFLRTMPRADGTTSQVAALPFNLPSWLDTGAEWSDLAEAFDESMTIAGSLRDEADVTPDQQDLLMRLLASDERKLQEANARTQGTTQSSPTDEVRDVLDWAAGVGSPRHFGHGRFWNLQNAEFTQVKFFGQEITTAPAGEDALIVAMLRPGAGMPQGRPELAEDSAEFKVVETWVADGCPE